MPMHFLRKKPKELESHHNHEQQYWFWLIVHIAAVIVDTLPSRFNTRGSSTICGYVYDAIPNVTCVTFGYTDVPPMLNIVVVEANDHVSMHRKTLTLITETPWCSTPAGYYIRCI